MNQGETRWAGVLAIVGAGVVASLQVGKVIIAAPLLRQDMGLDLASVGTLTAVFSLLGVVGGIAAGGVIARFGARRMLLLGLLATALGTTLGAMAPSYGLLLASRVVEGLGFLMITVAGPAALQRMVSASGRDFAFALWSCYMPTGMAVAMLASQAFDHWQAYWWCAGAAVAVALASVAALVPVGESTTSASLSWRGMRQDTVDTLGAAGPVLLALSFTLYSLMFFALFTFLPVLLMEQLGLTLAQAGLYSAIASAANIIGNLGAGVLLARGWRRSTLIACASATMGVVALLIFQSVLPAMPTFLLCVLFSAVGGLIPATLLGTAPLVAPRPALTAASVGLVMQGSNLGQVIGPVTVGGVIDRFGWGAASYVVLAAAVGGLVIAAGLRRVRAARL
ncbi:CynX/NimT family MFS transporter [Achromobacter sp. JUb104]|uniref:MFS transporter n=1 Tax=Achromobacter sp. JUb104 TaxID=2940590 RepID=UPI002166F8F0|nr:MFS transporter [Achromobacter sp. JUb104]MCS3505332.1 putative MFS family arabinose efflux permease [Achromobacter sp. JUb104]